MANKKKRLTAIETMRKFVKELQKVKDDDYSKVIPLTQITWRETAKDHTKQVLEITKEKLSSGNVGIRLKKVLSEVCEIIELRTEKGIYSTKIICEKEAYKTDVLGEWGVNPLSFHKM